VLMNITCTSDLTMEEMTEASDRIYNEVGEEAEIIWGAVIDDEMEEEMRVTVIATGIGNEPTVDRGRRKPGMRGKIRDITPADLQAGVDYDEPTFIRRQQAANESTGSAYRGYKGLVIDNNDLEIPTFMRKKAD